MLTPLPSGGRRHIAVVVRANRATATVCALTPEGLVSTHSLDAANHPDGLDVLANLTHV